MTDIITSAPLPLGKPKLLGIRFPKLRLPTSIPAIFIGVGEAFQLAYVAPFAGNSRHCLVRREAETEDRDPDW